MERAVLLKKDRDKFFNDLLEKSKTNLEVLAIRYSISGRTLRDWRRGKFYPSLKILKRISKDFKIKLPSIKVVPQYWYITSENARRAALKRMELYGPPGTPEGRRKGGLVSQENRRKSPEKYRALGCNVPKTFLISKKSKILAELFGIILGDGSITDTQVKITLNRFTDKEYAFFVANLVELSFGEEPSKYNRKSVIDLCVSGVELVKCLEKMGLKKGNKVVNQVEIPKWIMNNKEYSRACLRGLFDTDGGIYIHKHGNEKSRWNNLGWCFTNYSLPLMVDVKEILMFNGIRPRGNDKRIFLYSISEIRKFMETIGSSNPKNINKYQHYVKHFYNYE